MTGNEEYESNTLEILKAFLCHSKPIFKDKRKLEGYGLKMDDFIHKFKNENNGSYSSATKRMFAPRKNELLSNRYITRIRSKGKQTKHYAITPIGIAYLFQKLRPPSNIVTELFNQIIKHLKFYHETTKPKLGYAKLLEDHYKIFQIHDNTKPSKKKEINSLGVIFNIMKYVKITLYRYNEIGVKLSYPLNFDTELHYGEYLFTHKKIGSRTQKMYGQTVKVAVINSKTITDQFLEIHLPSQKIEMNKLTTDQQYIHTTEKEIYQKIATFIIKAFFYQSITNKIISYERAQNNKLSRGKTMKFKTEFKSIPEEYLWIVNDFHNELDNILMLNTIELAKTRRVYLIFRTVNFFDIA